MPSSGHMKTGHGKYTDSNRLSKLNNKGWYFGVNNLYLLMAIDHNSQSHLKYKKKRRDLLFLYLLSILNLLKIV